MKQPPDETRLHSHKQHANLNFLQSENANNTGNADITRNKYKK